MPSKRESLIKRIKKLEIELAELPLEEGYKNLKHIGHADFSWPTLSDIESAIKEAEMVYHNSPDVKNCSIAKIILDLAKYYAK